MFLKYQIELFLSRFLSLFDQKARKYWWKPQRSILILARALRLVVKLVYVFFPEYLQSRKFLSRKYFFIAEHLLQNDLPVLALEAFNKSIMHEVGFLNLYRKAICLLFGMGRLSEALEVFSKSSYYKKVAFEKRFHLKTPVKYLSSFWANAYGHIATIDYVIKLNTLKNRNPENIVIYLEPGFKPANSALLKLLSTNISVINESKDLPFDKVALELVEYDYLAPRTDDGKVEYFWNVAAKTYHDWYSVAENEFLKLTSEEIKIGWSKLNSIGIPNGSWFVGLHVREIGSKSHHARLHLVLNSNIDSYIPAIEAITSLGGWVIRIGDKSMKRLPKMKNVVDYFDTPIHSANMDIFISSQAVFFIGGSSGPAYVPPLFGIPCVLANWWPAGQRPWHPQDIFIPKIYRRTSTNDILALSETLSEPYSHCNSVSYLRENFDVIVEDNNSDDIYLAVKEMLDRIFGCEVIENIDNYNQAKVDEIYQLKNHYGSARIARSFLRSRPEFLR